MDFEKAVSLVGTVTELRSIASAHVIGRNHLKDDDSRGPLEPAAPVPSILYRSAELGG